YDAAMDWLLRLRERDLTTCREFEAWKASDPGNEFAFAEVEALFADSTKAAKKANYFFDGRERPGRWMRRWRMAGAAMAAGIALFLALPYMPDLRYSGAEAVAKTGEVRSFVLSDGTRVTLNTASAFDADVDANMGGGE